MRDKINRILPELPKDADPPVIEKVATDASPILNVAVSSPRDLRETTKMVDDKIKKNIESLQRRRPGALRWRPPAPDSGVAGRREAVLLQPECRAGPGRLAAQNVEVPGGRVDQGPRELSLRTMGRVERPKEFERIIVGNVGGTPDSYQRHRPRRGRRRRATFACAIERDDLPSCWKSESRPARTRWT